MIEMYFYGLLGMAAASVILNAVIIYLLIRMKRIDRIRMNYLTEQTETANKNINTLGRVMTIFEEETKILQKRKEEQQQVKNRFTRTPR